MTAGAMRTLALTGGIATGKSTFARLFLQLEPETVLFDCDAAVQELLAAPDTIAAIAAALGPDLKGADGSLNRALLRERVFNQPERRKQLEAILHPPVRSACLEARRKAREAGIAPYFLADVPLLYESGFPLDRDLDLVVACDPGCQKRRLMARNGFAPELADKILAAQLPIYDKMTRAHVVLWNGGEPDSLVRQTECLVRRLRVEGIG